MFIKPGQLYKTETAQIPTSEKKFTESFTDLDGKLISGQVANNV